MLPAAGVLISADIGQWPSRPKENRSQTWTIGEAPSLEASDGLPH
jgi:hypothetical protein